MFIYSRRVGTPGDKMENQIPEDIKHKRFDRLNNQQKVKFQKEIKELQNKEYIKREGGTRGRWHVLINCTT